MRCSNWQNKASMVWVAMVIIVALLMAVMWWQKSIHIQSDIFKLLPAFSDKPQVLASHQKISETLNQRVFVMLQSTEHTALDRATTQVEQAVHQSNLWQALEKNIEPEQFGKTLYQHRTGLLDGQTQQFLYQQQYDAFLEKSMLQLLNPVMPIHEQMLKDDPLLLFPQYMMEKSSLSPANIELEHGWATHQQPQENGDTLYSRLMVLNLAKSPYDIDYQQQTTTWLNAIQQHVQHEQVTLTWSGTLAFASFGTQSAKQEISTIGLGSSLGVILLVLFGFRSLRPLFTEFIAVSVGSLFAFAVTHWIFGEIHLMTLVFGASLIGVCVDFSFYFMAMQSQQRYKEGFEILTPLLPSLFLGLMTTIVAYLFLSITPFPAFKQISIFSMVGLFSAWITSILLLPRLPALNAEPALKTLAFLGRSRQLIVPFASRRYVMIVVVVLVTVLGLSQLKFNDDIRNLQSTDPHLVENDQKIRTLFSQHQSGDYFIINAETKQQLEQAEATLLGQLAKLQAQGAIHGVQAIGQWFNPVIQQQNIALLQAIPVTVLEQYATAMGIPLADLRTWQQQLATQPRLTMEHFKAHPLASLALSETERVVLLQGVQDASALKALQNEHVFFMQPTQTLSAQFAHHREHAQWLLFGAIVSLAVLLGGLYGRKSVLPLMLPVCLALSLTFAIQSMLGVELNLFSIMGCFLILGIGVDYAIFYRHGHRQDHVVAMALFLCMISTLLGFGLLTLSHTYAIFCFGLTVLCGVILSFIFATCLTSSDEQDLPKIK